MCVSTYTYVYAVYTMYICITFSTHSGRNTYIYKRNLQLVKTSWYVIL